MSKLIDELKVEHTEIIDTFLRVKALNGNSPDGIKKLLCARDMLLSHLRKEDTELYPALWKAAEKDKELKLCLGAFASEMEEVSALAGRFFEKYSCSGPDADKKACPATFGGRFRKMLGLKAASPDGYEGDFERFYTVLLNRIQKEETVLYQAYERAKG